MLRSNAFNANAIFFHAATILAFLVPTWENPTAIQYLPLAKFCQLIQTTTSLLQSGEPQWLPTTDARARVDNQSFNRQWIEAAFC